MQTINSGSTITAAQSIDKIQPTGGINNSDISDIGKLVRSLQADINHIKTQLVSLPPFPSGQRPPSPLARFQNKVEKLEATLKEKSENKTSDIHLPKIDLRDDPIKIDPADLNKPLKKILNEQKYNYLTSDPENRVGHDLLRAKFSLPPPNQFKYGRHQGGISNIELEKLGIGQRQNGVTAKPKRILPKNFRDDPFADPPPITENDIRDGMYSLLNRGVIPKDVDLTPAFERGNAPLAAVKIKPLPFTQQIALKQQSPTRRQGYQKGNQTNYQGKNQDEATFLTAVQPDMNINDHINRLSQNIVQASYHPPQHSEPDQNQQLIESPKQRQNASTKMLVPMPESTMVQVENKGVSVLSALSAAQSNFQGSVQILMRQGKIDQQSTEFVSFKRQNIMRWGGLTYLMQQIERLIGQYSVTICYLNAMRLLELSDLEYEKYSTEDLLSCVTNLEIVLEAMKNPRQMFKGPNGPVLATIKIQTAWRRHKAYSAFSQLKFLMLKATLIQRKYRLYQLKKSTKLKIQRLRQESLRVWAEMQEEFKQSWPLIKEQRRVEIHINSYSISDLRRMSLEKYKQRENSQLSRIFRLKDPNVDVIYVSPYLMTSEVTKYYMKILELVEIENASQRLHIIVPENYVKFHEHLSLTQALLYSPKACAQIQNIISETQAYIVPGKSSEYDVKLSIQLGVPILCGDPTITRALESKSGSKRIFEACGIPYPVSAKDIYDKKSFEVALTQLIAKNLDINVWIFKIDDEFGGRGHASLDVEQVRTVVELRKKKVEMTEAVIQRLQEVISKILPRKVKLAMPTLYSNWDEYFERFCKVGGVIEAAPPLCQINQLQSPSVSFLIEPDGQMVLVGSFDKFQSAEFVNAGCFSPQTSLPSIDLLKICGTIGDYLYNNGVFGHVTLDLVSFPNVESPNQHPFFWAVDISLQLTDQASVCYFFDMLMEGKLDQQTGEYTVQWEREAEDIHNDEREELKVDGENAVVKQPSQKVIVSSEPRGFMFCNFLHHPGLAKTNYKTLFHMCRNEQISFDMESRSGSTFCLYDVLQSAVLGMLTIGVHRRAAVGFMNSAIEFIITQAGNLPPKVQGEATGKDQISLVDITQRVKIIARAFDKASRTTVQAALKEGDKQKPPTTFTQAAI